MRHGSSIPQEGNEMNPSLQKFSEWEADQRARERAKEAFEAVNQMDSPPQIAHMILDTAAGHLKDRAKAYDKPEGERSMGNAVRAFSAVSGVEMTEEQGWLFMALLKAVRTQQGAYRADNYEDGAAYFALAGETAARNG